MPVHEDPPTDPASVEEAVAPPTETPPASVAVRESTNNLTGAGVTAAGALGAIATALFYFIFVITLFPNTYFSEMFDERGIIPYSTTFFTATGLFLILFAHVRLVREESGFEVLRLRILGVTHLDQGQAATLLGELEAVREKKGERLVWNRFSRAFRRIKEGVRRRIDLVEMLRDLGEIDYSVTQTRHVPVRTIVWLIPILGFIGTVFGISNAISEFSALFATNDDFDTTRVGLTSASMYLGVAFDTTLLSLVKTAILMVFFSAVQKREKAFLIGLDAFCVDDLAKRVVPTRVNDEKSETDRLSDAMIELKNVIASWQPDFGTVLAHHYARLEGLSERVEASVSGHVQSLQTVLGQHTADLDEQLSGHTASESLTLATHREALAKDRTAHREALGHDHNAHREALARDGAAHREALASDGATHVEAVRAALASERVAAVTALAERHATARDELAALNAQLIAGIREQVVASGAVVQSENEAFRQALGEAARALGEQVDRSEAFTETRVQALDSVTQQTVQASGEVAAAAAEMALASASFAGSVDRIGAVEDALARNLAAMTELQAFNECLDSLRQSTDALPGVLRELRRPRRVTLIESAEEI